VPSTPYLNGVCNDATANGELAPKHNTVDGPVEGLQRCFIHWIHTRRILSAAILSSLEPKKPVESTNQILTGRRNGGDQ